MDAVVFVKTEAGLAELRQRSRTLHPRLRALLILVDGQRPVSALRAQSGATEGFAVQLQSLLDAGLIQPLKPEPPAAPPPKPQVSAPETPLTEQQTLAQTRFVERSAQLRAIFDEIITQCFPEHSQACRDRVDQARSPRDFVLLANDVIVALNNSARVPQAVAFKQRVKPLLY